MLVLIRLYVPIKPRAYLVLEKILKVFNLIWTWQPPWSMDHDHFSNILFPCPKEPQHEILEQKSTVTAQNRCPKIRRDKCCRKASKLSTGQRLSFIIIVLQTLALSYQSRPIYSESPYTIRAIVYLPSISISLLSIFIFW